MRLGAIMGVVLVLGAVSAYGAGEGEVAWRKIGDKAPGLNIDALFGPPVKLADGVGKRVYVIEFWATWCGPCKFSIPQLSELQERYRDDGLVIVGISDEPEELVRPYIEEFGEPIEYTIALDRMGTTKSRYMGSYGLETIPVAFVIDMNGRVAWHGHPSSGFLERLVVTLLSDIPEEALAADSREPSGDKSEAGTPGKSEKD